MAAVRVVAGTARGRHLEVPAGDRVRPTSDRVREAMFNALGSMGVVEGARVVDLFAGSGALGIEALSRGAASVVFVEPDRAARSVIAANLARLGLDDPAVARIVAGSAEAHLATVGADRYDLALVDPPYVFQGWAALFETLATVMGPNGVVVVESDRELDPAETGTGAFRISRQKRYGGTVLGINVRTAV